MSADKTTAKHAKRSGKLGPSAREDVERFRKLTYELLTYSTHGLLRRAFLPKVSERIKEYSGCDAIELWVKEDPDKHF